MDPADILVAGARHIADRADTYDNPTGERSMDATVAAFNAISGKQLSTEQGWLFMILLKAVRSQQGAFKQDNYEDGAAYFALMCEEASVTPVDERIASHDGMAREELNSYLGQGPD
jgi:hypothetical protein